MSTYYTDIPARCIHPRSGQGVKHLSPEATAFLSAPADVREQAADQPDWLVHFEELKRVEARRAAQKGKASLTPTRYERATRRFYPFRLVILDYSQPSSRLDLPRPVASEATPTADAPPQPAEAPPANAVTDADELPSDVRFVVQWYLEHPELITRAVHAAVIPDNSPKPPKIERIERHLKQAPMVLDNSKVISILDYRVPTSEETRRAAVESLRAMGMIQGAKAA